MTQTTKYIWTKADTIAVIMIAVVTYFIWR